MGNKSVSEKEVQIDPVTGDTLLHEYASRLVFRLDSAGSKKDLPYKELIKLTNRINVNSVNLNEETMLHTFLLNSKGHEFAEEVRTEALELFDRLVEHLKRKQFNFDAKCNGLNVLELAMQVDLPDHFFSVLLTHCQISALNVVNETDGNTLIHRALLEKPNYLELILNSSNISRINFVESAMTHQNANGDTPVDIALRSENYRFVYILMDYGIDFTNHLDKDKELIRNPSNNQLVIRMYTDLRIPFERRLNSQGDTLLHLAMRERNEPLVRYLLQQGVNVNIKNNLNEAAIDLCTDYPEDIQHALKVMRDLAFLKSSEIPLAEQLLVHAMIWLRPLSYITGEFFMESFHYKCDLYVESLDIANARVKVTMAAEEPVTLFIEFAVVKRKVYMIMPDIYDCTLDKRFYSSQIHRPVELQIDLDAQIAKKRITDISTTGFEFLRKPPGRVTYVDSPSEGVSLLPLKFLQSKKCKPDELVGSIKSLLDMFYRMCWPYKLCNSFISSLRSFS